MVKLNISAIFIMLLLLQPMGIASAGEFNTATFKKDYLKNFKKLQARLSNVRIRMRHERPTDETIATYLILDNCFQSRTEYRTDRPLPGMPNVRVRSLAEKTGFFIEQQKSEGPYNLITYQKDLIPKVSLNEEHRLRRRERTSSMPYALAAFHIQSASLEDIFKDKTTEIVSISQPANRAGLLCVNLKLDSKKFYFHHLELYLNPEENMSIYEYKANATLVINADQPGFKIPVEEIEHVLMQYDSPVTVPVPKEIVSRSTRLKEGQISSMRLKQVERLELSTGSIKKSDFTLSHFGIEQAEITSFINDEIPERKKKANP